MFQEEYSDMVTIEELREMLLIGKNTAYALLNTGQIHAFKIGKTWKIPRDAVSEYVMRKSNLLADQTTLCRGGK